MNISPRRGLGLPAFRPCEGVDGNIHTNWLAFMRLLYQTDIVRWVRLEVGELAAPRTGASAGVAAYMYRNKNNQSIVNAV